MTLTVRIFALAAAAIGPTILGALIWALARCVYLITDGHTVGIVAASAIVFWRTICAGLVVAGVLTIFVGTPVALAVAADA